MLKFQPLKVYFARQGSERNDDSFFSRISLRQPLTIQRHSRGSDEAAPSLNWSARLRRLSTSVLSPSSSKAAGQGFPLRMECQFYSDRKSVV